MKIQNNRIYFTPCVPDEWEEYAIQYKFKTSIYNIKIKNKNKTNQVQELKINGLKEDTKMIKLMDNNQIYNVEIII